MTITSSGVARPDPRIEDQFIDIICADDALMQAEFEAIVAAEWATSPPVRSTGPIIADGRGARGDHRRPPSRFHSRARGASRAGRDLLFARAPPDAN